MALSLSSPGISIKEVDLTQGSVESTSSFAAGIVAPFAKGPVGEVITIRNENELLNTFGAPSTEDYQYEYWYSASNYMSYGGNLRAVRADSANLKNSNAGVGTDFVSLKIKNNDEYEAATSYSYYWAAKNPGYWSDGIKVCVIDNFADQVLTGVVTTGLSVGFGVTQALSSGSGHLKGIITEIREGSISVKVTNKVLSGEETSQEYTEKGIYSFNTSDLVYIGDTIGVGETAVTVTRQALGTNVPSIIGSGTSFTVLNYVGQTEVQLAGGDTFTSSEDSFTVSSSVGIDTGRVILIGTELFLINSFIGNTVSVRNGGTSYNGYGTTQTNHFDGDTVKIFTSIPNATICTETVTASGDTIKLSTLGVITVNDYLITTTNEILKVDSVSNVGSLSPSTADDWYNQQYLLSTANGDKQNILWRSVAPRPTTNRYVTDRGGNNDALHVAVIDNTRASNNAGATPQQVLEIFRNLSKAKDAQTSPSQDVYYVKYLAENSKYIYAGSDLTTDSYWEITEVSTAFSSGFTPVSTSIGVWGQDSLDTKFNSVGNKSFTIRGGKDYSTGLGQATNVGGYSVQLSDITNSLELLANTSEVDLNFLLQGSASGSSDFEQSRANALISIADRRKDCIAFISPYRTSVVNSNSDSQKLDNILEFFTPLTSTSYAVFDSGYQYVYDRFNKVFTYMPCSADVAGLCVRTDVNQFPWYSPAGKNRGALKNIVKLAYNPSQDDRDQLYQNRINPIITYPGSGTILFGDKTALGYSSAFDRINVRRLFITIEKAVRGAADDQLFEFNDATTRANFINIVEPYLRDVQANRGITDFLLVCDESNNTPDVIDRNEFIADIYVKPARSINFIGLTFIATRTGVSFETIVGTV